MEETSYIEGVILKRTKFRENDSKITLLAKEKGKIELVARGTSKLRSKLSGHVEPITYINGMIVKGKQFDYLGSAIGMEFFPKIKSDLNKLSLAGKLIKFTDKNTREDEYNPEFLSLLNNFLQTIEKKKVPDNELYFLIYAFKFSDILGLGPELGKCLDCGQKLKPGKNFFSYAQGGTLCRACGTKKNDRIEITDNTLKFLRLIIDKKNTKPVNIKITKHDIANIKASIDKFIRYHLH